MKFLWLAALLGVGLADVHRFSADARVGTAPQIVSDGDVRAAACTHEDGAWTCVLEPPLPVTCSVHTTPEGPQLLCGEVLRWARRPFGEHDWMAEVTLKHVRSAADAFLLETLEPLYQRLNLTLSTASPYSQKLATASLMTVAMGVASVAWVAMGIFLMGAANLMFAFLALGNQFTRCLLTILGCVVLAGQTAAPHARAAVSLLERTVLVWVTDPIYDFLRVDPPRSGRPHAE